MGNKFKKGRRGTEKFLAKHKGFERKDRRKTTRPPDYGGHERRGSCCDPDERY